MFVPKKQQQAASIWQPKEVGKVTAAEVGVAEKKEEPVKRERHYGRGQP